MRKVHSKLRFSILSFLLVLSLNHVALIRAQDSCGSGGVTITLLLNSDALLHAATELLCPIAQTNSFTLEITAVSSGVYEDTYQTLAAGGNTPTLALARGIDSLIQNSGLFYDLNALEIGSENLFTGLVEQGTIDDNGNGVWVGLPLSWGFTSSLVWYNPATFEEFGYSVPQSFDELVALIERIPNEPETVMCALALEGTFDGLFYQFLADAFFGLYAGVGGQLAVDTLLGAEGSYENDAMIQTFSLFQDWGQSGALCIDEGESGDALKAPFLDVPTAFMAVGGSYTDFTIHEVLEPSQYGSEYAFFPMPSIDGDVAPLQVSVDFMVVYQDSTEEELDAARLIVDYFAGLDGAQAWAQELAVRDIVILSPVSGVEVGYTNHPSFPDQYALLSTGSIPFTAAQTLKVTVGDRALFTVDQAVPITPPATEVLGGSVTQTTAQQAQAVASGSTTPEDAAAAGQATYGAEKVGSCSFCGGRRCYRSVERF